MIQQVVKFFKEYRKTDRPLLLAFSGGPDSLALLRLLVECRERLPLTFAVAHVDHGWRAESNEEAAQIALMVDELKVPFHVTKLDPKQMAGNLEAACREARLQFFAALCKEHEYEAVLLAHHADDQAETVLKRTLEGVTLPYLSALSLESHIYGMKVWRPLLAISKDNLLHWLGQRGLKGFDDATNRDPKFLRARLRTQVLPALSEMFGKEVSSGLCAIGMEAGELRSYLDERVAVYLKNIVNGSKGYSLDLNEQCPDSLFELKYLLRQFCKTGSFILRRDCIGQAARFVQQKTANKCFQAGSGSTLRTLYIDRGHLLIPHPGEGGVTGF